MKASSTCLQKKTMLPTEKENLYERNFIMPATFYTEFIH